MKINHKSKLSKFLPFVDLLTKESEQKLKDAAVRFYLKDGFWSITLGAFLQAANGNFDVFFSKKFKIEKATVFQYYLIAAFKDFVDEFSNVMSNLSLKPTIDEAQASSNLTKVEFSEGFLVYAMKTFGYKSSKEAEECILIDFLMRKKDDFNNQLFQRNIAAIHERKYKK
ncbi:MAG TPA: hypothetical protein PLK02_07860 [Paludibacteraceae bacterium]|nr:hypothetical protein [Paludibacteraceae bacterium]